MGGRLCALGTGRLASSKLLRQLEQDAFHGRSRSRNEKLVRSSYGSTGDTVVKVSSLRRTCASRGTCDATTVDRDAPPRDEANCTGTRKPCSTSSELSQFARSSMLDFLVLEHGRRRVTVELVLKPLGVQIRRRHAGLANRTAKHKPSVICEPTSQSRRRAYQTCHRLH